MCRMLKECRDIMISEVPIALHKQALDIVFLTCLYASLLASLGKILAYLYIFLLGC